MARCQADSRSRKGVASVWVALMLLLIVGLVGAGIDAGYVGLGSDRLQDAADASALAAASQVRVGVDQARAAAIACAGANTAFGEPVLLTDGDIVVGRYDRAAGTFVATTESPNAVRVHVRRDASSPAGPVPLIFGRAFGVDGVEMVRFAVAMRGGETPAGLVVLNEEADRALWLNGNALLTVTGGAVHVNSSSDEAMRTNGHPILEASALNVVGGANLGGLAFDGELTTGVSVADDPLENLPAVEWASMNDLGSVKAKKGTTILDPGYYSGGITGSDGKVVLNSGIYVLDGAGLDFSGKADLTASGVLLYITGSGKVDLTGQGSVQITPPDPETHAFADADTYAGVSIFQDRSNTSEVKITGNGDLDVTGTIYLPAAHVKIAGNGDSYGNQIIADTVKISGNGEIQIDYDGRFPLTGSRVFLVE